VGKGTGARPGGWIAHYNTEAKYKYCGAGVASFSLLKQVLEPEPHLIISKFCVIYINYKLGVEAGHVLFFFPGAATLDVEL
jgi:hypothetical protein